MSTILIIIFGILGDIWSFVSQYAGLIVVLIFGYIALKDLDRAKDRIATLMYDVRKIKEHTGMNERGE